MLSPHDADSIIFLTSRREVVLDIKGRMDGGEIYTFAEELGKNIRQVRKQRGFTQVLLAQRLHVSSQTMSRIEHGKVELTCSDLNRICKMLDCDLVDVWPDESVVIRMKEKQRVIAKMRRLLDELEQED